MAFQVKYRCEFKDVNGIDWKVEIEQDPWAGAVTSLVASDDPLRFEWNAESDDVFDPIKTSEASLTVWSQTSFALTDLYSEEDLKFRVKIYEDGDLYWTGYIITDNYSEPYIDVPYPVTITASCGLEQLKNVLFDDSGTYYDGRRFESQIIIDILGKIGYTGFTEYINLYEETMDDGVGDSPLDQIKIDVDIFQDMYCYEVLKEVLKKYNACITHKAGGFVLYRPTELIGATVYGRIFTAYDTKSATTFTPIKYIDRVTNKSTLRQIPGGVMMIQRPIKEATIFQDYKYKESWIDNWQFKGSTFAGSLLAGYTCDYWTQSVADIIAPMNAAGIKDGIFLITQNNYPTLTDYISQTFGVYAVNTSNVFMIEFDYLLYNFSNTDRTGEAFYIRIKSEATGKYLYGIDDNSCAWDSSLNTIILTNDAPVGSTGWINFKRTFNGIPDDGEYTITFYALNDAYPQIYVGVKDVKFYCTSDKILFNKRDAFQHYYQQRSKSILNFSKKPLIPYLPKIIENDIVQKEYIITNAINGRDDYREYILGDVQSAEVTLDNVIEQFAGSLAVSTIIGYTGSTDKVDTVTVNDGGSGSGTVSAGGISRTITWSTDADTTITNFITNEGPFFTGLTLTKTSANTFTITGSYNFTDADISASFGSATNTIPFSAGTPVYGLGPTIDWNSYDGTHTSNAESKPLLEIIGDEIAEQYSRPKQLIQMALYDEGTAVSAVNILGNYQDELNQVSAANRKYVFNRGEFGVKFRNWSIDLMEII